jgi:hypothetical protein
VTDEAAYTASKQSFFETLDWETRQLHVVFAQGKTGTSTIAAGLKRAGLHPVFQIHTLEPRVHTKVEADYARHVADPYPRHVWEAQWLRMHLPAPEHPWMLVTSVRDPIARIVSRFFQQKSRFGAELDLSAVDALVAELSAQFQGASERLGGAGWDWFEAELKGVLGMSVYDVPFDPEVGFGTIATDYVKALFLRGESLDKAPAALTSMFGGGRSVELKVELKPENVSTDKDYATLYQAVLDRFRPPASYVERVYETRMARHFYSGDELEGFRRHWTRPFAEPS